MTDRRANTLHYASSLSGVTHASDFSTNGPLAWPQLDLKAGSMIRSSTCEKTTIKTGNTSAREDLLFSLREIGFKFNLEISAANKNLY